MHFIGVSYYNRNGISKMEDYGCYFLWYLLKQDYLLVFSYPAIPYYLWPAYLRIKWRMENQDWPINF